MNQCPCGSSREYPSCCGLYLDKNQSPQTPEILMRSRYTAYTRADIDYLKKTMSGKPLINFSESEAKIWANKVTWIGLKVIHSHQENSDKGYVEFIATYLIHNTMQFIHEISEFHRKEGVWFYVDGVQPENTPPKQKISQNMPCPCGSLRKFKNCHGLDAL